MKLWKECTESEKNNLIQLMDDMIPYYERIAVYNVDREFVRKNRNQCMSIALAARKLTYNHTDIKPEEAIFSDDIFGKLITEAWEQLFTIEDKIFFNANLQNAAECFRMGIMMADLPEIDL